MGISNNIISRVRETLGRIVEPSNGANRAAAQSDYLVKMNLPPLMGRRDAAYDLAYALLRNDVFAMSENQRRGLYSKVADLLFAAISDTKAVLITLSSPDTESREQQLLDFMLVIHNAVETLEKLLNAERQLFGGYDSASEFAGLSDEERSLRDEQLISESEISLVHRIRTFLDNGGPRISRYREYTHKSFSRSNAERYRKALEIYIGLFRENTTSTDELQ